MTEATQAGVGTAHLSSDLADDGPWTVHGVALGDDDVTVGSSGIKKKWPADELRKAAETLEGKPLVKDHENNTDGTVGTVVRAAYREGVGVLYEAEIAPHYEELAKDIGAGILEVSARAYHAPVEELDEDGDTGALEVEDVAFDNLAVVSQGASPSNSVQMGEAAAMAEGPGGDCVAVMEQGAPRMDAAELAEAFDSETSVSDSESEGSPSDSETSVSDSEPESGDSTESDFETEQGEMSDSDDEELGYVYDIGDLIEWGDGSLGSVTGVFVEDGVHKYEVRVLEKTGDGVEPTDESEMVIAHNACAGPHVPTSDLAMDEDEYTDGEANDVDAEELKSVAGVTFDGTSDGKLDESEIPNDDYESHYLFPDDTKSDSSYPVVDADGNLRKGNVSAAHQLGARGGVSEESLENKLMALNEEWPEGERPIETSSDEEENSATMDDDARDESSTVAALTTGHINTTNTTTMEYEFDYSDATDEDIEEMSDPVVIEEADVEDLREKAARADELDDRLDTVNSTLDELASNQEALEDVDEDDLEELREYDDARVLSGEEYEELQGLVDEIGGIFAEELADYSPFDADELQERFTPMELRAKVDEHDDASVQDELGSNGEEPDPDGGSASTEELENGADESPDEPSDEDKQEFVASELESSGLTRQAEKVRSGEIDYEEILGDTE